MTGDVEKVQKEIEKRVNVNSRNDMDLTPLYIAAQNGNMASIQLV